MIKQTGLEGLSRRRCGGTFQTVLSLSLSKVGRLVFNFRDRVLRALGSLCLLFNESSSPGAVPFPGRERRLRLPGLPAVERFHLCMAVLCVGKDFKKQLAK